MTSARGGPSSPTHTDHDELASQRLNSGPQVLAAGIAHNLMTHRHAMRLRALGLHEPARVLAEYALTRRRRVLAEDHPDTLHSAHNLAIRLRALGQHKPARQLHEDTLTRQRRVLCDDHPDTLRSAN